jgi:hypothetical protein
VLYYSQGDYYIGINMKQLPQRAIENLGYYVYLYVNPIDNQIFYVGKGKGNRVLAHLSDESETRKTEIIKLIRSQGKEPHIEILIHGLDSSEDALKMESAAIDLIGVNKLSNQVRGYGSSQVGRASLKQLVTLYNSEKVEIDDPVILIRINRQYRYDLGEDELYEVTRGVWRIGARREKAVCALSVFRGLVREVYRIEKWLPAGSTEYNFRERVEVDRPGRWEFIGRKAQDIIRNKYIDKSVEDYFPVRSQNPITYVNC